jgi:competence protein ComEC
VVVTHGDLDHCGGLVDVAVHVPVREIWSPAQLEGSACLRELRFWSGAPVVALSAGDRLALGEARIEVLWPERGETAREGNAISLVLRLQAGATSALLTGDLDGVAERRLVARAGDALASDLLKVGHHGSAKGTGAALLAAVRPRLAWISSGPGNRFGHPAGEVLARLAEVEARTLRTDLSGEIVFRWARAGPVRLALPASPRPPA